MLIKCENGLPEHDFALHNVYDCYSICRVASMLIRYKSITLNLIISCFLFICEQATHYTISLRLLIPVTRYKEHFY